MTEQDAKSEVPNVTAPRAGNARLQRVGFSFGRLWTIAEATFTEAVRQKVFNFLLLAGLIFITSSSFFSQFSFGEQLKSVKDTCLGAISVLGTLIAIVGTAMLLPNEIENRTIYTTLAKPVRRVEFLLGKYAGSVLLIFISLALMSFLFAAVLLFKEHRLIAEANHDASTMSPPELQQMITDIHNEARDPDLLKAVLLIFVKLSLLAAITLLVSTFSTSMVFNVSVGIMAWLAGNLVGTAKEVWGESRFVLMLLAIIPDFGPFNIVDDIVLGNVIPWAHVGSIAVYGISRTLIIIIAAYAIFADREI